MNINPSDILTMKKKHPCGSNKMIVLRAGMDFKLRCEGCGHEFMVPRSKIEKNIKSVVYDRGGYVYHGVVKELAEAAREAGLEF